MTHNTLEDLLASLRGIVERRDGSLTVIDEAKLRADAIDELVFDAVFGPGPVKAMARWFIWELGQALGVRPASIHEFYMARGRGEYDNLTVPAMNLRGMTYDMARAVFRAALKLDVGAMIFEIARSEIGYTDQRPAEYTAVVLAAAIKEGFRGLLFIQGDHFQVKAKAWAQDPDQEVNAVKELVREAVEAGFYNIDIDTSTLVDLSRPTVGEQQRNNFEVCADIAASVRSLEFGGITISLGGEIGEVGGKNSTEEELRAFMDGYNAAMAARGDFAPMAKISIQTGTSHGGVVLPDGTLARVKIDFDVMRRLSKVAREEYGMAGAVQHGASTLPEEAFGHFVEAGACEVHLATGFQNIIYEHPALPKALRDEVYAWLDVNAAGDRRPGDTDEQFYYKTRKKGFGPFKREWWTLPEDVRGPIGEALEERFALLFEKLNVTNTMGLVKRYVTPPVVHRPAPEGEAVVETRDQDIAGLAD